MGWLLTGLAGMTAAAEMQGVIADWNCVKAMVHDGREKILRNDRKCSLLKGYNRAAYGLITDEKKFYKLDDPGNAKILQLLKDTRDRDNLHVIVMGDIQGGTIKVVNISEL